MRIVYVCTDPGIPVWGVKGASIHVQEMLRAFLARGAGVTLISPRMEGAPPAGLEVVRTIALPAIGKGEAEARARRQLALNEAVAAALAGLGRPNLIYERHALFAHAAMEHARRHATASVLEVNAPLIDEQARHRTLALPEAARTTARRALAAAGTVVAVSEGVATYARDHGAARVAVIANGVDPARFPPRPAPEGPFTFGFLGSLKPWHDVPILIEALARLRAGPVAEARLLIVGDGPERPALEARLAALGLSGAADFTGALPAAEVPAALARMHAAVAPYAAGTPFYFSPLKLYEYMAAGLPVIASATGDLAEVVAQDRTGLLVPPGDADALATALAGLAADPSLRTQLGRAARAEVMAHHGWDRVAGRVLALAGLVRCAA